MAIRFHIPAASFLDSNGDPLSGAKLEFYESGTTTALDTFSDEDLATANANPVVADSSGRFGDIWLKGQDYKVILKTSADVTVTTMDPVNGALTISGDDFKVAQQSPADMTVSVGVGTLYDLVTKTRVSKTAQTSGAITAPSSNPRIDVVYIDIQSGVIGVTTGAEAASPSVPTIPDDKLPLAQIALATTTTEITDSLITDIRELANIGAGAAATKNTGADAGEIAVNEQDWTALASAATVNIGAAASERVNITGTTTITAFDTVTAGLSREVRFDGALTLTHNGTSLILPGSANITTASGDVAKFVSEGSGNWRCVKYQKVDGNPVAGNAVIVLDKDQSQLEIVNTVTETSIYSYSVPAGTLGTDSALRVTINGDYLNNSGASRAIGLKVKYGATTLYDDDTSTISIDADRRAFSIDLLLAAKNSTSAQHLNGRMFVSPAGTAPTSGYGTAGDGLDAVFGGSSSEDSTAAKTLDVTITHPAADANLSIRAEIRMIELVP